VGFGPVKRGEYVHWGAGRLVKEPEWFHRISSILYAKKRVLCGDEPAGERRRGGRRRSEEDSRGKRVSVIPREDIS